MIPVNTKNILFICGGAFDGIEKKIAARMNTMVVGFNAGQNTEKIDRENFLQYIAPQDLKSFGLIPEIIGRLPVLTYLEPLDRAALRNILNLKMLLSGNISNCSNWMGLHSNSTKMSMNISSIKLSNSALAPVAYARFAKQL